MSGGTGGKRAGSEDRANSPRAAKWFLTPYFGAVADWYVVLLMPPATLISQRYFCSRTLAYFEGLLGKPLVSYITAVGPLGSHLN